jgi:hypothetical protein
MTESQLMQSLTGQPRHIGSPGLIGYAPCRFDIYGERIIDRHRKGKCSRVIFNDEDRPLSEVLTVGDAVKVDKRESVHHGGP